MPLSSREKARLYHDLGTLLKSGFHLDRGLELMLGQDSSAARRNWLESLAKGLAAGHGMTEALQKNPSGSSELEIGLLAAGERGGRLDEACAHLAAYFELRQQSLSKAVGALVYPLIVAHLAVLVPDFSKVVAGGLGAGFSGIPLRLAVLWGGIALVIVVSYFWLKTATRSASADRCLGKVPLAGVVRRHWALARFSQVMQTCLLAALKFPDALRLAGGASQSAMFRDAAESVAVKIEAGGGFAASLRVTGGFPQQFVHSMEIAEQSGTLDVELGRWATMESQLAAHAQDRAAEWIPRIFYILVVLFVAWRVIGMFSGYYRTLGGAMDELDKALHR